MIVSMQGNWTVEVKSKHASYPQQFIINGANSGYGVYEGVVGGDPGQIRLRGFALTPQEI